MATQLRFFNELRQWVVPDVGDMNYTAVGGVTRTQASKDADIISIFDFGGLGDNSTDNTPPLNAALIQANNGRLAPRLVNFAGGTYLFNSAPTALVETGISYRGVGQSITAMIRNYNESGVRGLFSYSSDSNGGASGSFIEHLAIAAGAGTTGGSAISIISGDPSVSPDFILLNDLVLTYQGAWATTLLLDGSARTTGGLGLRDIKLVNVNVFSNGWPSVTLKNVVDLDWNGGNIAGLATDVFSVTGAGLGFNSTNVNIQVDNMDSVSIDNTINCHIRSSSIQGAVTIASSAVNCVVESEQVIGGTITNNSTTSWVRSGTKIVGPSVVPIIDYAGPAWTAFTATLTPDSGTISQVSDSSYQQSGKTINVTISEGLTVTSGAPTQVTVTLPIATKRGTTFVGREFGSSGNVIQVRWLAAATVSGPIRKYDNSIWTPATGNGFSFNSVYEAA